MKEPKIKNAAICFSGQLRTLELCYPYIKKNLLDLLKSYDIFCFIEGDANPERLKMLNPQAIKTVQSSDIDHLIIKDLRQLRRNNYKKFIFPETPRFNFKNMFHQFYNIKGAFTLLREHMDKENISYRYFIRIRFDFLPISEINPENFKMRENEVIVPNYCGTRPENEIVDMFYITKDFDTFKTCSLIYDNFANLLKNGFVMKFSVLQKIYFFLERNYLYFLFAVFNKINPKSNKFLKQILSILLFPPKLFFKDFKVKNETSSERILFYYLKSEKKVITEKKIDFIIVRNPGDGLLILG
ncbi:MAG TPA: hypothetical protein VMC07_02275 [Candidatus Omnitrophota bacterium]|nr:hypothetical protein [Candidatus Omnitrophota bacterium]